MRVGDTPPFVRTERAIRARSPCVSHHEHQVAQVRSRHREPVRDVFCSAQRDVSPLAVVVVDVNTVDPDKQQIPALTLQQKLND